MVSKCAESLSALQSDHSVTLIAAEMGPFSCRSKGVQHEQAFPLSLVEQVASSLPWAIPRGQLDFQYPFNAICGHALPRRNQKTAKTKLALVMATKPPESINCLRRSPVPDLWLLKCQRYPHHSVCGEEGLRRANSILCCNFDFPLQVALSSSTSLLVHGWMMGQFLIHFCNVKFNMDLVLVGAPGVQAHPSMQMPPAHHL